MADEPINGHAPALDIDAQRKTRNERLEAMFGRLVLSAGRHERYRTLPIADLQPLLLAPLLADRVAFGALGEAEADPAKTGIAIWASVSEAASATIADLADRGVFPVRLEREDWRSGNDVWLIDIIAPSREVGSAVFAAFARRVAGRFRMHPAAMATLDHKMIEQIRTAASQQPSTSDGQ